jgi:multicomponent Na+:H+ antiporter subunit D
MTPETLFPDALVQFAIGGLVLLPLLAATLCVLLPHTPRRILGAFTALAVLVLSLPVIWQVSAGDVVQSALGGYDAPLGIRLRADGLSAAFLALTSVVGATTTLYAAAQPHSTGTRLLSGTGQVTASTGAVATGRGPQWEPPHAGFWPLWLGCWAGLNAVFLSGDLFNTYVGLELVGLTAVALVALGGRPSWAAALRYLFIAVAGSLLFLVGTGLIVAMTGTLDIEQASSTASDAGPAGVLALTLISVGLALKLALVPMHRWLIPAHAGSPSAVSPLLSALVIKAALFVLLRCWLWLFDPDSTAAGLAWGLAGLGVLALVFGSIMALRQTHLKRLIAYSTVAQVGYWFLMLPLIVDPAAGNLEDQPGTELAPDDVVSGALAATVALALGHGLAKSALFLAAGYLKDVYGTDEIAALRGVGQRHPMLVMSMGLAAVGLVGLPISLSFTGKWQLATSAVAAGHYWILIVLVVATLLSAAYMLRVLAPLLIESEDDASEVPGPQVALSTYSRLAPFAPLLLGTLTIATGLLGVWFDELLEVGAPW